MADPSVRRTLRDTQSSVRGLNAERLYRLMTHHDSNSKWLGIGFRGGIRDGARGKRVGEKILASLQTDFPALYELITRSVQVQAIVDEIEPDGWSVRFDLRLAFDDAALKRSYPFLARALRRQGKVMESNF